MYDTELLFYLPFYTRSTTAAASWRRRQGERKETTRDDMTITKQDSFMLYVCLSDWLAGWLVDLWALLPHFSPVTDIQIDIILIGIVDTLLLLKERVYLLFQTYGQCSPPDERSASLYFILHSLTSPRTPTTTTITTTPPPGLIWYGLLFMYTDCQSLSCREWVMGVLTGKNYILL